MTSPLMSPFTPHKLSFAHLPTPLQPLTRLSALLGGPRLWIKRDDCTGLALGGNKVRKLEYLVADAVAQGATRLITAGPLQSNHCRQTAAAAAAVGLECELVIEDKVDEVDHLYLTNGNILLDRLLGARLRVVPRGTDARQALSESAAQCRADGGVPYEIAVGASSPIGALGYVNASVEIHAQAQALKVRFGHVVHASGSGGTQAGLLAGHAMLRSDTVIHGVDILGDGYAGGIEAARAGILALARETLALIGHERGLIGD
ncbi:MAG: pyridoxal-phosphate dependent enzyme, partial [Pseudomonadota bacterium]